MATLRKYFKRYWHLASAAILFLIIESVADLLQPTIMAKIIDQGVTNQDLSRVFQLGAFMVGITAIGAVGAIGRNVFSSSASQRIGADLRSDLFKKINKMPLSVVNQFETATLITRLTNDVNLIQNFSHRLMRIFIRAPILLVGSVAMAVYLSPKMSLIFLAIIPLVTLVILYNFSIGIPFFSKVQIAFDRVNGVLREYLAGIRVVKAFNRALYEGKRFAEVNARLTSVSIKTQRIMAVFSPLTTLVVNLAIVAVFWFGGGAVKSGSIEIGVVVAYINYMIQVQHSLRIISRLFNTFVSAKASLNRIEEVFQAETKDRVYAGSTPLPRFTGSLCFEEVSFSYNKGS